MLSVRYAIATSASLLLSGCGGGGSTPAFCDALGGGGATTMSSASVGSVSGEASAFDGSLTSAATITPVAASADVTVRGTAQAGVVAAAGERPGVMIRNPAPGQSVAVTINTYLDGVLQESRAAGTRTSNGSQACAVCYDRGGDVAFIGFTSSQTYDAIEAQIQISGGGTTLSLFELCNGNI